MAPPVAVPTNLQAAAARAKAELLKKHGEAQRARIERGVDQVASLWRRSDGDEAAFVKFMNEQFIADPARLDATFDRFEEALEQLAGHFTEITRELSRHTVLDIGPVVEIDKLLSAFDAAAHLSEDLFESKIAFVALANFPLTTLDERLQKGETWTRRQWAEVRLAGRFARRIPAQVQQGIARAASDAELYIAEYNIWMHHLIGERGERQFARGLKLISHWNLRDDLKSNYAAKDGLPRQRMIAKVMERIITQTIPRVVINNPTVDWNPWSNAVTPAPAAEIEDDKLRPPQKIDPAREPDTRYQLLLATFRAARAADPYSPLAPTHILRSFELEREIPEQRVRALLEQILTSPLVPRLARLIEKRLGRKLEPFDIWYDGFRPRARYSEADLDVRVGKKYPTVAAYQKDIPNLLKKLGFSPQKARFLADHIVVEPARGAGHALGADRRGDNPHLRTRIEKGGMNYKGYNIAIHEMGHNVEQIFSLYEVDHTLLRSVPNVAFTEALAFVFQGRDLELLGLAKPDQESQRLKGLNDLWGSYEIAGVALVDMGVWHWMYEHPDATPTALREATVAIAREIWNRYYAPVLGTRDAMLLAIYSHMISAFLYLPDYPLGHLIAAQIEEHVAKAGRLGPEFERMATFGSVVPDLWMKHATGSPVDAGPLLRAAQAALDALER
ncbi:MAG TPA: hypothetical protein VKN99_01670 [Polyangia bacterium]|nr:hypothetical protein [Polyangia bacterium]